MKDFFKDFLEGCWLLCVALVIATVLVLTFFLLRYVWATRSALSLDRGRVGVSRCESGSATRETSLKGGVRSIAGFPVSSAHYWNLWNWCDRWFRPGCWVAGVRVARGVWTMRLSLTGAFCPVIQENGWSEGVKR